jgi:pimeloyl-ACP methyl ester carboxylesterase
MMCDARLFGPQITALSGRWALHLAPIGSHNEVDALAGEILADAPPVFALAGLSMGGIVAMAMLARAPERISKLALLDTNPLPEAAEVSARREPQMVKVRAGRLREVMRDEMKPNYLAPGPRRDEILDLCMAMALDLGPEVFLRQSRALQRRPDRCEVLRRCAVPTLLLCGAEDRLCRPERHRLMAGIIAGALLEVIEGAGHLPTLERPEATTAALIRWLEL